MEHLVGRGYLPAMAQKLHGGGPTEETPEEGSRRHCSHAPGEGGREAAGRGLLRLQTTVPEIKG